MVFNVLLVGAGEINFGSPEGPWNHTARLEAILGMELRVVALIDPDVQRSRSAKGRKQQSSTPAVRQAWQDTRCYMTVVEASQSLHADQQAIDLIIVGCPPHFRGTLLPGKDVDVQLLSSFPRTRAMLIEKPIAAADPTNVDCRAVLPIYAQWAGIVGVGYMLRYLSAVQTMKRIMKENNLIASCINARYFMAYEYARKLSWWDKDVSCGPVVEQATHFVDLVRYLADSPCLMQTVHAQTVEHDEPAGLLSMQGFDEAKIQSAKRVPRITMATWKHAQGTIGSLCHGISLHGTTYDTQLEVLADGWLLRLSGAYTETPRLDVMRPGSAQMESHCAADDPFLTEIKTMVNVARDVPSNVCPLSTFDDALQTYELTWAIRKAGEQSAEQLRRQTTRALAKS